LDRLVAQPKTKFASRMLDWADVRAMRKEGISFGSHTLTHPNVGKLSPAELDEEIGGSKAIMEHRLQEPVRDFSFPFGQLSQNDEGGAGMAEATILRHLGYRSGVTSASGLNRPGANCFMLRRYQMAESAGGFCGPSLFALRVERILRQ
jgi:peptidoglycan/xylan/chitin deacetylase (PgdA/CDA1 family)